MSSQLCYMVSVRLMTFNHEAYIQEALSSILAQKTNFLVEVVVGDDFSADSTLDIVRKNESTENIHIRILERHKGDEYWVKRQQLGRLYNFYNILENCTGKYVAFLDGDDYWTDPLKLQKQVDYLETNLGTSLCFHRNVQLKDGTLSTFDDTFFNRDRKPDELLWGGILLSTVMLRRDILDIEKLNDGFFKVNQGDVYLLSLLSEKTGAKYISNVLPSVYRFHQGGVWSQQSVTEKISKRIYNYLLFDKVPLAHRKTYYFVLMNFSLDLVVACVKNGRFVSAIAPYFKGLYLASKSVEGMTWFLLFHIRLRYKSYISRKLKKCK